MSKVTRKDFLNTLLKKSSSESEKYNIEKDSVFKKYSNKSLPLNTPKTRASIAPYAGAWGEKQQIHLLKRLMFGVKKINLTSIQSMTMAQAVDALVDAPSTTPGPPINFYQNFEPDTQGVPFGQTWINTPYDTVGTVGYWRYLSTQHWWYNNIINQTLSIEERMIIFWHNHFATSWDTAGENRTFYKHLLLLKTHARGNFKTFVKEITKDAMMLMYLNGQYNNKYAPDENYARELQELFTIGKDPSYYTQNDVQEMARVLTGYTLDLAVSTNYAFDPGLHDEYNKTFSSFYNNTIITGIAGPNGENELDSLLNMIFAKTNIVAKFICRKLYRYFIHYDITTDIETNIITPLAQTFINSNWEIKPVLKQLFKSDHFYETMSLDCLIRNPMDYYLGLIRTARVNLPPSANIEDAHDASITLYWICQNFAMVLGSPPNVAGWPAYHQTPQFHQIWINSDTLPNRMEYTDYLFNEYGIYANANVQIKSDVIAFAKDCATPSDPVALVNFFLSRLLSFSFTPATKNFYKSILLSGQSNNAYWTGAWFDYINNPTDPIFEGIVRTRLQQLLTQICRLAEHQIS